MEIRNHVAAIKAQIAEISALPPWEYDDTNYRDELLTDLQEACDVAELALFQAGYKP